MTNHQNKKTHEKNILHIVDANIKHSNDVMNILFWKQHVDKKNSNQLSIIDIVEDKSDELRKSYLEWIYDIGETNISDKKIIEHLEIRQDLSYWWMTSLAHKFNISGTSQINNSIKLLALEAHLNDNNFNTLILSSDNIALSKIIKNFCFRRNINFKFYKTEKIKKVKNIQFFFNFLPNIIKALIYLCRYFFRTLPLYFQKNITPSNNMGDVMFFDILTHLNKKSFNDGKFYSNYWTVLVNKINSYSMNSNWAHLFFKHPNLQSINNANKLLNKFTLSSKKKEFHQLVEKPLTIKALFTITSDFLRLRKTLRKLKKINNIYPLGSDFNLWLFHDAEWKESLGGIWAMDNCIKLYLFTKLLEKMPKQRLGFYVSENQPWEIAMLYAWRFFGHGKIVGVPHTTIRFWDLRYFHDKRIYNNAIIRNSILPDLLAVNGPVALDMMVSSGYLPERIVEVEALRYMHLLSIKPKKLIINTNKPLKILICGDFLKKNNEHILNLISEASNFLPANTSYTFKPHPAFPYDFNSFQNKNLEITEDSLSNIITYYDVILTSNITSVSVEAYFLKIPLIQISNGEDFNLSPLRKIDSKNLVKSSYELADILNSLKYKKSKPVKPYFFLDKNLKRWTKLLHSH